MRRITAIMLFLALSCLTLWVSSTALGCQVDEFYLTSGGHLAGTTQDNLNKAEKANPADLATMLDNKEIIRLQDNIRVKALERSVECKMIKIKFMDTDVWVREDALKRIQQ